MLSRSVIDPERVERVCSLSGARGVQKRVVTLTHSSWPLFPNSLR